MDVWAMSLKEREDMLCHWRDEIDARTIFDSTAEIHRRHQAAITRKRDAYDEADLNQLASRELKSCYYGKREHADLVTVDIIGMTTTVCARQWSTLKQLGAQIVICEVSEIGTPHHRLRIWKRATLTPRIGGRRSHGGSIPMRITAQYSTCDLDWRSPATQVSSPSHFVLGIEMNVHSGPKSINHRYQ